MRQKLSIDLRLLVVLLVVAVLATAVAWLAGEVREGVPAVDTWALKALRHADNPAVPIGPKWIEEAARDITAMGSTSFLFILTALAALHLFLQREHRAALTLVVATVGGALVSQGLKELIRRPRPQVVPHLAQAFSASFPSGHSMLSAVVYLTLGTLLARFTTSRALRLYYLSVAFFLMLLVGTSRVFLGVHYPTDVLAGWLAGVAWALGVGLVVRALQRRGVVEQ